MTDEHRLAAAIGKLYEAACDPTKWRAAIEGYADLIGARGAHLLLTDASSGAVLLGVVAGFDESVSADYVAHYGKLDERIPRVLAMPLGQPVQHDQLYKDGERRRSITYNEFLQPNDGAEQALVRLGGPPGTEIVLGSIRALRDGVFDERELRLAQEMFPHIERAVRLSRYLVEVELREAAALDALDLAPFGSVLLSEQGSILAINRRARSMLGNCRELLTRASRLHAARADDDSRLQKLLASAIAVARGEATRCGTRLAIAAANGGAPIHLLVTPMPMHDTLFAAVRPAVAVFIHHSDDAPAPSAATIAAVHGLTPTEARLAAAIASATTLKEFAAASGMTRNTARWHLKHVLDKLGARNQADLVRVILSGPAGLGSGDSEVSG